MYNYGFGRFSFENSFEKEENFLDKYWYSLQHIFYSHCNVVSGCPLGPVALMGWLPFWAVALMGWLPLWAVMSSELEGLADGPQADDDPDAAVSLEHCRVGEERMCHWAVAELEPGPPDEGLHHPVVAVYLGPWVGVEVVLAPTR